MNKITAPKDAIEIELPASKSVLNRALLLSAFQNCRVFLRCGALCADTRSMIGCLRTLGVAIEELPSGIIVEGCGGNFNKKACIDVQSAGTAARFLPVILAFCGGEYLFLASTQMRRRPMDELFVLEKAGVKIKYINETGKFPFQLSSKGISEPFFTLDTNISTQFASGFFLAACASRKPCSITLSGKRAWGSYLKMTTSMLSEFGFPCSVADHTVRILPPDSPNYISAKGIEYIVEPDLSAACYLCAAALLCRKRIFFERDSFGYEARRFRFYPSYGSARACDRRA